MRIEVTEAARSPPAGVVDTHLLDNHGLDPITAERDGDREMEGWRDGACTHPRDPYRSGHARAGREATDHADRLCGGPREPASRTDRLPAARGQVPVLHHSHVGQGRCAAA